MIKMGWTIYNIPMHAKVAILYKDECLNVFLSSNNWQAGGNFEFIELVDNYKAWIIKLSMDEALKNLKPVNPV